MGKFARRSLKTFWIEYGANWRAELIINLIMGGQGLETNGIS